MKLSSFVRPAMPDELLKNNLEKGSLAEALKILSTILTIPLLNYLAAGAYMFYNNPDKLELNKSILLLISGTVFLVANIIKDRDKKIKKNSEG